MSVEAEKKLDQIREFTDRLATDRGYDGDIVEDLRYILDPDQFSDPDPWETGQLGRSMEHARVADSEIPMTPKAFGKLIREKRKSQGMTQSQLADRIGVTKGAISHWELGRVDGINPVNLHWLAQVLRLTDEELVLFAGRPKLSFPELPPFGQTDMEVIHMYSRLHENHRQTVRVILQGLLKLQGEDDGCERFDGPLEEGD